MINGSRFDAVIMLIIMLLMQIRMNIIDEQEKIEDEFDL